MRIKVGAVFVVLCGTFLIFQNCSEPFQSAEKIVQLPSSSDEPPAEDPPAEDPPAVDPPSSEGPPVTIGDVTLSASSVSHGASLTITGSGFGQRADNNNGNVTWNGSRILNFRFKDFEDNSLSSQGFYPQKGDSVWSPLSGELNILAGGPLGSTRYMRRAYGNSGESGGLSTNVSGAGNQLYTTFKFMMPANTQSGKFFRLYANSPQNNIYLATGCANDRTVRGFSECTGASCQNITTEYGGGSPNFVADQWYRAEVWADASTNTFAVSVNGDVVWSKNNWLNLNNLGLNGHTLDYPNMIDSSERSAACPAIGSYNYDDIFVDFTRARVELSASSTWANAKRREVQIPVSWNNSSITIKVNAGEMVNGTNYLYIVKADGTANANGYPVTISGR